MKTREELNAIKNELEAVNRKLAELSEDELKQVVGGYRKVIGSDKNAKEIIAQKTR